MLNHIETTVSGTEVKQIALDYLDKTNRSIEKNIEKAEERIDFLISKGSIAKEHTDIEFESLVEQTGNLLEDCINKRIFE